MQAMMTGLDAKLSQPVSSFTFPDFIFSGTNLENYAVTIRRSLSMTLVCSVYSVAFDFLGTPEFENAVLNGEFGRLESAVNSILAYLDPGVYRRTSRGQIVRVNRDYDPEFANTIALAIRSFVKEKTMFNFESTVESDIARMGVYVFPLNVFEGTDFAGMTVTISPVDREYRFTSSGAVGMRGADKTSGMETTIRKTLELIRNHLNPRSPLLTSKVEQSDDVRSARLYFGLDA
jgi:hypothetical protein